MKRNNLNCIDLFAGAGGFSLAAKNVGLTVTAAIEMNAHACATYQQNIIQDNSTKLYKKNILDISPKNIRNECFFDGAECDIILGGPPCQGFSVHRIKSAGVNDPRNALILRYFEYVAELKPKVFLMENVPGILSLGKGKVVEMIEKEFSEVGTDNGKKGYEVRRYLLNAVDYGVPQNRKRVIFLGISKEINEYKRNLMFSFFPPIKTYTSKLDDSLNIYKTLKEAIFDLPEPNTNEGKLIPNHTGTSHVVKINGYLGNRQLFWDKPSPTIVGRGGGTGGPVIAIHPNLERRFTVRETARIQTFPDNFIFYGSVSSQYRQIGNAVAVEFAKKIGESMSKIEKLTIDKIPNLKIINI